MTKIKSILFGLFGLCLLLTPALAQTQTHPGQRIQEIYKQLDLTDDQKKQLEANKQQERAKMEATRQVMKSDREALQGELMKTQLDMPKINILHDQIKVVQSQMEDERLSSILVVRSILTPDQFSKFVNLLHKHKQEHNE